MPKSRLPKEVWFNNIRPIIWQRDKKQCVRCKTPLELKECHIDHIVSGKLGTNKIKNLRTLCIRCHVLRADLRHQGMIANALTKGIIDVNWREHVWYD